VNGDKLTRWTAVAAVVAVAAVAALISYRHAVTVVTSHGEPGMVGHLYPVVIDGLIVAASMVLLDAARHREQPPALSLWLLGAGIGATLAANILAGVSSGLLGSVVAAWPAAGFVGCYELLMLLVRASARRAVAADGEPAAGQQEPCPHQVAGSADEAAVQAFLHGRDCGDKAPSQRQLAAAFGLSRAKVAELVGSVNGRHPQDGGNDNPGQSRDMGRQI
jgi:Protein of unknown function (DUF2637)